MLLRSIVRSNVVQSTRVMSYMQGAIDYHAQQTLFSFSYFYIVRSRNEIEIEERKRTVKQSGKIWKICTNKPLDVGVLFINTIFIFLFDKIIRIRVDITLRSFFTNDHLIELGKIINNETIEHIISSYCVQFLSDTVCFFPSAEKCVYMHINRRESSKIQEDKLQMRSCQAYLFHSELIHLIIFYFRVLYPNRRFSQPYLRLYAREENRTCSSSCDL